MTTDEITPRAASMVESLEGWLAAQTLGDLFPKEDLKRSLDEWRADDAYWEALRPRFDEAWARSEARLRKDSRPVEEVLSEQARQRLLDGFESIEPDPDALRTFLRSPAIEKMLGEILYTGIFEFIKKVDLIGAVVNRLPVIGGIRRKVMGVFKDEIDNRLGGQIEGFLGGFSGLAVERMIQFVLSEENQEGFRKARRRLGEHLLERPVSSLLPDAKAVGRLRDAIWSALRNGSLANEKELIDLLNREHGADRLGDWTWKLSENARKPLGRSLTRFLASDAAQSWGRV